MQIRCPFTFFVHASLPSFVELRKTIEPAEQFQFVASLPILNSPSIHCGNRRSSPRGFTIAANSIFRSWIL